MTHSLPLKWLSFAELLQLLSCEVDDDDFYLSLGQHLSAEFPDETEALLGRFRGKRLRGLISGLTEHERGSELARNFLNHPDEIIVSDAIDTLRHLSGWDAWAEVEARSDHPSEWIRSATLRYRCARLGEGALPLIQLTLQDPAGRVRENAVDELDDLPIPWETKVEIARPFLKDDVWAVREAAAWIVEDGSETFSRVKKEGVLPPEEGHA